MVSFHVNLLLWRVMKCSNAKGQLMLADLQGLVGLNEGRKWIFFKSSEFAYLFLIMFCINLGAYVFWKIFTRAMVFGIH